MVGKDGGDKGRCRGSAEVVYECIHSTLRQMHRHIHDSNINDVGVRKCTFREDCGASAYNELSRFGNPTGYCIPLLEPDE